MEGRNRTDVKRAICRAYTNVITKTSVAESIDPKAFLMMLNTQFPALYRGGTMHLAPLWDLVRGGTDLPEDAMIALFVRFAEASDELAVPAVLPDQVARLSAEERRAKLALVFGEAGQAYQDPSGFTPLVEIESFTPNEPLPAIQLTSADLRPVVDEGLKRKLSIAVGQAVRTTPIGTKVESAQIAYLVDNNFDVFCNGMDFAFDQLVGPLKEVPEVTELEIMVLALRMVELLTPLNLGMKLPALRVDHSEAAAILAASGAARRAPSVVELRGPAVRGPSGPNAIPQPDAQPQEAPPPATEKKEGRLAKWGFRRQSKETSKLARVLRPVLLGLAVVIAATVAFLFRPNRSLDVSEYNAVFPMRQAKLLDGTFLGYMDDARWFKLTYREREHAVRALEAVLKNEGLIPNLQIFDTKNRMVVFGAGGALKASEAILREQLPAGDTSAPAETARPSPKQAAQSETKTGAPSAPK